MSDEDHEHPDQLIRDAIELKRLLSERELNILTRHVAQAGFDDLSLERPRTSCWHYLERQGAAGQ